MTDFVKVCPKCKHPNPEYLNVCEQCQQFIGMEVPVAKEIVRENDGPGKTQEPLTEKKQAVESVESAIEQASFQGQSDQVFQISNADKPQSLMYLEIADSGQLLTIKSGEVIGQDHATGIAEVKIPDTIKGVEYIHRQHCRFDYKDGNWFLVPLDQSHFNQDFTNPTLLNRKVMPVDLAQKLADGDVLHLSAVKLIVRLVS